MESCNDGRPRDGAVSSDEPKRPSRSDELRFTPRSPVHWFSPSVLRTAALRVAINSAMGAYLDKRELQTVLEAGPLRQHEGQDEIWIDYISDTGDGFAPTYSVAWLAGREKLVVADAELPRADVVVFGGDEVYPIAAADEYENRFVGPYEASLPWLEAGNPEMYFVAGNHDWYDGLTSFLRMFCQRGWVGARRTCQTRSYFALQLPHRWWLWGLDVQFQSYIDEPQLRYFENVVNCFMRKGDRVILCTAVPSWTHVVADDKAFYKLGYVEQHLIDQAQAKLMLTLSGDSHHYAHYLSNSGDRHKITAGGGGAFLHGTNALPETVDLHLNADPAAETQAFQLGARYPGQWWSRLLALGAVTLPLRNWTFLGVPAVMFLLLGWSGQLGVHAFPGRPNPLDPSGRPFGWFDGLVGLQNPLSALLILSLFAAAYGFARPPDKWSRKGVAKTVVKSVMGGAHIILQGLVFTTAMWLTVYLCRALGLDGWGYTAGLVVLLAVLGGAFASLAVGVYLALCCALFSAHGNEAFSAMGHTGYKNFLRLHIDSDGVLHVYPLGLRKATKKRKWALDPHNTAAASWLAPATGDDAPKVHFIEPPFSIDGRAP